MCHALIVGGDMRNVCLAEILANRGCRVTVCGINTDIFSGTKVNVSNSLSQSVSKADMIVLPLPMTGDGIVINTPLFDGCLYLSDIWDNIDKECFVFGGKFDVSPYIEKGMKVYDYASRTDFAALNAVPTAEGAIEAVMKHLPVTLFSCNAIVTGFGKCAKVLALTLKALGAKVTVCARSIGDLSLAKAMGMETVRMSDMKYVLGEADVIFNTVPHRIFNEPELKCINKGVPLADVASAPGGADSSQASQLGVKYLFLPGLPGKYSPTSAAEIILKTVENIIAESGKDAKKWIYEEKG